MRWLNELALEHPAEQPALMERRLVEIEAPAKLDVRFGPNADSQWRNLNVSIAAKPDFPR